MGRQTNGGVRSQKSPVRAWQRRWALGNTPGKFQYPETEGFMHCPSQGGLNDQAHQTCKNLEYAIAIATRPGAIEYYKPSEETMRVVENGELAALTAKIARLQRELDQIEQDIEQARTVSCEASARAAASGPSFASLKDWFAAYGDPRPPPAIGYLTYFEDSSKIYGGTNHHRAFKTQARAMKKGRLIR